ncbi:hypothetical protein BRAS3843_1730006 [Bradyrhizobium sp. STM 3843]|nr:hypothetical protein BRAS3843_1730006 [Bradyrhizobium sp. STM 3843]
MCSARLFDHHVGVRIGAAATRFESTLQVNANAIRLEHRTARLTAVRARKPPETLS